MNLYAREVLEAAEAAKTKEEKIAILKKGASKALGGIITFTLSPEVEWLLPEGNPFGSDVGEEPSQLNEGLLDNSMSRMYLFHKGGNERLSQKKREDLFANLLFSLEKKDAALFLAMKDKKWPYPSLTVSLINTAFPGLIPSKKK